MAEEQLNKRISILEDKYNMSADPETQEDGTSSNFSLGKVHIFNNQEFDDTLGLSYRNGSEKDVEKLKKTFEELNFPEPLVHEDLNYLPFQLEIEKIAKDENNELEKCRSLVCVFLSHGEEDHIYMKDDKVEVDYIYRKLSNIKNLQDKPKIFIFQACRGSEYNHAGTCDTSSFIPELTSLPSSDVIQLDEMDASEEISCDSDGLSGGAPRGADCLTAYATTKGYFSFRCNDGSWFIQKLCEVLQDYAAGKYDKYRPDIMKLLTLVSAEVSERSAIIPHPKQAKKLAKQMPSFVSSFRKQLFLRDHDYVAV